MINFLTRGPHQSRGSGATSVQELLEAQPADDPSATALFDHEYKRQLFQSAASEVKGEFAPATWQAFWQTAVEDRPPAEVAAELGLSVGSVYVARSRVLARIRRQRSNDLAKNQRTSRARSIMAFLQTGCDPDRLQLLADDRLAAGRDDRSGAAPRGMSPSAATRSTDWSAATGAWRACAISFATSRSRHYETGSAPAESLHFLAPSDWPDSMGRLGTYEVKGILGRGGMGVVLKAFDPALNRNVAIKVLSASLATTGAARSRFLREARAAAAVVHEHVVGVFAVAESAGLPFLVMEYVSGRSLQDRLDRDGPLSVTEVLRIGMQTAAGLAAAHAQGLVHRDVKPANILLENSVERVRLTDFGLARAVADAGMSHSGVVAGTPYYMAPEQARGDTTDHRADLFSLGSTLYAICAGHPPFRAETPAGGASPGF